MFAARRTEKYYQEDPLMFKAELRKSGKKSILFLSGDLTQENSEELKKKFDEALAISKGIELVFGTLENVDITFLQLLCSAHKSARWMKKRMTFGVDLPEIIWQAAEDVGLPRHAGCFPEDKGDCFWMQVQ
jgi:anti-anti-sigma regulatory factor